MNYDQMNTLYIGLPNFWRCKKCIYLFETKAVFYERPGFDWGWLVINRSFLPGSYIIDPCPHCHSSGLLYVKNYHRLHQNSSSSFDFVNTSIVGRYEDDKNVVDVVFRPPLPDSWSPLEKEEWLKGKHGLWTEWSYDIFSSVVADLVMFYLQKLPPQKRTPLNVIRYFGSLINSESRPDGILVGKWSSGYEGGIHPLRWRSTAEISEQRLKTNQPVKYAQCWVFAESLTTYFRFLGLPARTVYIPNARITYQRGADLGLKSKAELSPKEEESIIENIIHQESQITYLDPICSEVPTLNEILTFGKTERKEDELVSIDINSYISGDGLWNFHLWTEVWTLGDEHQSAPDEWHWQCIDGSPHLSSNKFLGPCPVTSIRDGKESNYDYHGLYTTFNGVTRYWKEKNGCYYVYKIKYLPSFDSKNPRKVKALIRDPERSIGNLVLFQNISDNYSITNLSQAVKIHHQSDPIIFYWEGKLLRHRLRFRINTLKVESSYIIQFAFLDLSRKLIECVVRNLNSLEEVQIPRYPWFYTHHVSILMIEKESRRWWVTLI